MADVMDFMFTNATTVFYVPQFGRDKIELTAMTNGDVNVQLRESWMQGR